MKKDISHFVAFHLIFDDVEKAFCLFHVGRRIEVLKQGRSRVGCKEQEEEGRT